MTALWIALIALLGIVVLLGGRIHTQSLQIRALGEYCSDLQKMISKRIDYEDHLFDRTVSTNQRISDLEDVLIDSGLLQEFRD